MSRNTLVERRIRFLIASSLVVLLAFSVRLVDVQAVRAQGIAAKVTNELTKKKVLPAPRGAITDANGSELARSVISYRVIVDQSIISSPAKLAALAAPILGMNAADLTQELTGTRRYVVIAQSVSPIVWNRLTAVVKNYNLSLKNSKDANSQQLAGFFMERLYTREYPSGYLAASIIGFINQSGVGAAGLEHAKNTLLTGTNGEYLYESGVVPLFQVHNKLPLKRKKATA